MSGRKRSGRGLPLKRKAAKPKPRPAVPVDLGGVLEGGSFKVTLVIGGELSGLQVWDVGHKGTPENPVLVAEQGYERTCPMSHKGLVKEKAWAQALASARLEGRLAEELDGLLFAVTPLMNELRRRG